MQTSRLIHILNTLRKANTLCKYQEGFLLAEKVQNFLQLCVLAVQDDDTDLSQVSSGLSQPDLLRTAMDVGDVVRC